MMSVRRYLVAVAAALLATAFGVPTAASATESSAQSTFIQHAQSLLCLDGSITGGVTLKTCNGGLYQQWVYTENGQTTHPQSGLCLDGSRTRGVRLARCNGSLYQAWFTNTGFDFINGDILQCLDASVTAGISLKPCNRSAYQNWYL